MKNVNWTRRDVGRLAAAGLIGAQFSRGQRRQITAREVVERIRQAVSITTIKVVKL